jgi:hypothetical protein
MKKYQVKILDHRLDTSGNGNLQVVLNVEPIGEYAEDGESYEVAGDLAGKRRRLWLTVTENTAERRIAELKALAAKAGKVPQGFDDFDATMAGDRFIDLAGVECDATMKTETWNGKVQERWDLLLATEPTQGDQGSERPAASFVKQANAQWGHLFKAKAPTPAGVPY